MSSLVFRVRAVADCTLRMSLPLCPKRKEPFSRKILTALVTLDYLQMLQEFVIFHPERGMIKASRVAGQPRKKVPA